MSAAAPIDRLKLLTLNLWTRQGPWERRRDVIRAGIARLQPDLIGLQEVLRHEHLADDQGRELGRGMGYDHVVFASAWELGGGLHFGNALVSRWPILDDRKWELPGPPGQEARCLLYAEIDAPFGRLPVFVTHLSWKLDESPVRLRQVAFIAERMRELGTRDKFPAILLGDLNAEPLSDEIRFLRGWHPIDGRSLYMNDCWDFAGDGTAGHTYSRRNDYARVAREPSRRLDYIFVSLPDRQGRGEPLGARVIFDQPEPDGVWASDHFGVFAEIAAAPRPLPHP